MSRILHREHASRPVWEIQKLVNVRVCAYYSRGASHDEREVRLLIATIIAASHPSPFFYTTSSLLTEITMCLRNATPYPARYRRYVQTLILTSSRITLSRDMLALCYNSR